MPKSCQTKVEKRETTAYGDKPNMTFGTSLFDDHKAASVNNWFNQGEKHEPVLNMNTHTTRVFETNK